MTDEELVLRARQGDTGAFDDLVVRHQGAVYRTALAALRHREEAEEAAQDAFVRAWTGLARFRGQASFRTWLLTIAWHRALARRRRVLTWGRRRADASQAERLPSRDPDPETTVHVKHLAMQIRAAITQLAPKLRDALLLAQSGEFRYGDMADMLGVPTGTVKWRVAEARRRVRARVAAQGDTDA